MAAALSWHNQFAGTGIRLSSIHVFQKMCVVPLVVGGGG
jgi:hypothetical protein